MQNKIEEKNKLKELIEDYGSKTYEELYDGAYERDGLFKFFKNGSAKLQLLSFIDSQFFKPHITKDLENYKKDEVKFKGVLNIAKGVLEDKDEPYFKYLKKHLDDNKSFLENNKIECDKLPKAVSSEAEKKKFFNIAYAAYTSFAKLSACNNYQTVILSGFTPDTFIQNFATFLFGAPLYGLTIGYHVVMGLVSLYSANGMQASEDQYEEYGKAVGSIIRAIMVSVGSSKKKITQT